MKSTLVSKENNIANITIEYSSEEFDNAITEAYKRTKNQFSINGFRKGKAPRKIIESHYGKDIFYDEALNELLKNDYPKTITDLEIEPIDQPIVETPEIKQGEPVVITIKVELSPEIEIKDYEGIEIEKISGEVTEEDIKRELENVQKEQARLETITDRASEKDDTVIIDFEGTVDGEKFDGGTGENFELKLGSGQFIPGFEDQLIGKNSGDEVKVEVRFPDEYGAKDLAGKDAVFMTKIHEIKKEVLPEIDDELASDVSDFETLEEYKKDISSKLQKQIDERNEIRMKDAMLETILEKNDFDIPNIMISDETDRIIREMEQQLGYQGLDLDTYIGYLGKSRNDLRSEAREDAKKRVGTRIIIQNIIRQENIEASQDDIDKEIEEFAKQYGQTVEQCKKMLGEGSEHYFKADAEVKKAINMMFDKAVFVEPKKEETKKDEPKEDESKKDEIAKEESK